MKPFSEIAMIPKWKVYFPDKEIGIARGKMKATKHRQLARVVFSTFNGIDVVQLSFKKGFSPTTAEIEEAKQRFFKPEEIDQCEATPHPSAVRVVVIYREQNATSCQSSNEV